MSESTELAPKGKAANIIVQDDSALSSFLDTGKFEQTWRAANVLAKSDLVPVQYKNKPENCFLAFTMAQQVGMNPFTLMQKTYVVQGKLALEAQLVIALLNTRGPFKDPVQWEFKGEGNSRQCTAYATHKITGSRCEATVTWAMVEGEGWSKNSKWRTMPDVMFRYRSASFLASFYCPEVKFGMMTLEEAEDVDGVTVVTPPQPTSPLEEKLGKRTRKQVESTVRPDPTNAVGAPTTEPANTPTVPDAKTAEPPKKGKVSPAAALGKRLVKLVEQGYYIGRDEDKDPVLMEGTGPGDTPQDTALTSLAILTNKPVATLTDAEIVAINKELDGLTASLAFDK